MKEVRWNLLKSERLKRTRGVSFDELIQAKLLAVKRHPTKTEQRLMLFEYRRYVWVVPYLERENEIFLKTLYPSRKYTKLYKRGGVL